MEKRVCFMKLRGIDKRFESSFCKELLMDEKVYVAVGRDLVNRSTLVWAIQNTGGKEFCIVHVHKNLYKEKAQKILDKYLNICRQMKVRAETIHIEMDSVEKGIIQLISERSVKKLVMGAASDRHYSMRMVDLLSAKAIYVRQEAPATCHIWFTCKEYLVYTREAISGNASTSSSGRSVPLGQLSVSEAERSKNEAIKRAKEWASAYFGELKRREETETELKKSRETLEKMRIISENRITESHMLVINLQDKYNLAIDVLRRAKKDRDELKTERDIALIETEKLKTRIHEEKMMIISRSDDQCEVPPQYFICPISQEVMEDPRVAADGFTYEAEYISSWFERGHVTSPMTNTKLLHTKLVPNLALRSAIQQWLHASTSSRK